ncbi:hypothetical protein IJ818_00880 [bacterium]|nr:hypothetical protein [bacterium]
MATAVQSQVAMLKNQTAMQQAANSKTGSTDITDKNMFLQLMLKEMEYQDPTEPVSNQEWLAQMAQYSSLEAAQNTTSAIETLSGLVESLSDAYASSANISQTLSLLGKEVTVMDPSDSTGETTITGTVDEASFESGSGTIKVNGKSYPIAYIKSVKN